METLDKILRDETVNKDNPLRCAVCKNFLSVSPVVYNDKIGSICGREPCKVVASEEGNNFQQKAFEALAKFSVFPCMHKNNGCQEKLLWDQIEAHEKACKFSKIKCPFSDGGLFEDSGECEWEGNTHRLLEHMEDFHSDVKFENYLQVRLEDNKSKNKIFFKDHEYSIIFIILVVDQKYSYWKVWITPEIWNDLTYRIEISSENRKILNSSKILKPDIIYPGFSINKVDDGWFKVDFDFIKNFFGSPEILTVKFYQNGFLIDGTEQNSSVNLANSLQYPKCSTCGITNYLLFICEKMHLICNKCKIMHDLKNVREEIIIHCPICNLKLYNNVGIKMLDLNVGQSFQFCVMCGKKVHCLSSHIFIEHFFLIYRLGKYYEISDYHFCSFDDNIFLFSTRENSKRDLVFSVKCLGECDIKYKYELNLLGTHTYSAISFSNICYPEYRKLSLDEEKFQQLHNEEKDLKLYEILIPEDIISKIFPHGLEDIQFKLDINNI